MPNAKSCSCSKGDRSPEHPCPNHAQTVIAFVFQEHTVTRDNVPGPRAYAHQSIHAPTIIMLVLREHTVTRASMPKPRVTRASMPKPRSNQNSVRAPRAHQSIHAQTIITFLFRSMRSPEHPCPNHNDVHVPRAYAHQSIHAQTITTFVFQEQRVTRASMLKAKQSSCSWCSKSIQSPEHSRPNHNKCSCSKSIRSPEHPCRNHNPLLILITPPNN